MFQVRPKSSQKQDAICVKHPRNKAEIFCVTCETPICHVCATLKHKSSPEHECIEAMEATENRRQRVTQSLEKLEQVKAQFREVQTKVAATNIEMAARERKIREEIIQSYEELLAKAEKEKASLFKAIDDVSQKESDELQKYRESAEANITYITDMQSRVETIIGESSDSNFLSMYDTVIAKIDQLCLKTPDDPKDFDIYEFTKPAKVDQDYYDLLLGKLSFISTSKWYEVRKQRGRRGKRK